MGIEIPCYLVNSFTVIFLIELCLISYLSGRDIPVLIKSRRGGDSARFVADAGLARNTLGWQPKYTDLETIVRHAWEWE